MSEELGFMNQMRECPEDTTIRLVYADWLDENGRGKQAEFVRLQCEIAALGLDRPSSSGLVPSTHRCSLCGAFWQKLGMKESARSRSRRSPVRVGDKFLLSSMMNYCNRCFDGDSNKWPVVALDPIAVDLLSRQAEVLSDRVFGGYADWIKPANLNPMSGVDTWFRFGSLDRLYCSFDEAVAWLPEMSRKHPLRPSGIAITGLVVLEEKLNGSLSRYYLSRDQMSWIRQEWVRLEIEGDDRTGFDSESDLRLWLGEKLIEIALKSNL